MKTLYNQDLFSGDFDEKSVELNGWVAGKRDHKNTMFIQLADSSGTVQLVIDKTNADLASKSAVLTEESAVRVEGIVTPHPQNVVEVQVTRLEILNLATEQINPHLRDPHVDVFDPNMADQLLNNRHLYIRNPKLMAILRFRHMLMGFIHNWFREQMFTEITAPILTPLPLYEDRSAVSLSLHAEDIFLTQCVGFYLESAVHAFERVYNIGPSFRREESRSKRHLIEYWHIKAEFTFANLEDVIGFVEKLQYDVAEFAQTVAEPICKVLGTEACFDGLKKPFPRITYRQAIKQLQAAKFDILFGKSLGSEEEEFLSRQFDSPFWVVGIPRSIEPFPYVINPDDPDVTQTADLIASRGYGELLGVAEKISDLGMLDVRMREKNREDDPRYEWTRQLRKYGFVPHVGFGLGVERYIRWLLGFPHVRDAIPFPRAFGRKMFP